RVPSGLVLGSRLPSRSAPRRLSLLGSRSRTNEAPARARGGAHVQFEHVLHHDDRLRAIAILGPGELQRLVAADKETAAKAALIPRDPVAMAVPADQE